MRHYLPLIFIFLSLTSQAQFSGNGFYRLQNKYTERYVRVRDGYGRVDVSSTNADMTAVQTISPFSDCLSDPASVLYIEQAPSSNGYDIKCQGVSLYSIIGYYIKMEGPENGFYRAYAEKSGYGSIYLADDENSGSSTSSLTKFVPPVGGKGMTKDLSYWYVHPVNTTEDHYLGVNAPLYCQSNGKYYTSYYTSFSYSFTSNGMKAYYVKKVDPTLAIAVYQEITTNDIPQATPVILECSSATYSENRLDVHSSSAVCPSDNILKGVYFCRVMNKTTNPHNNFVANDTSTMRVLGVLSDGSLGYMHSTDKYLPENSSYLTVPAQSPSTFRLMTESQYEIEKKKHDGLNSATAEVERVRYFNLIGNELAEPSEGVVLVVTTYKDGREVRSKIVYRP